MPCSVCAFCVGQRQVWPHLDEEERKRVNQREPWIFSAQVARESTGKLFEPPSYSFRYVGFALLSWGLRCPNLTCRFAQRYRSITGEARQQLFGFMGTNLAYQRIPGNGLITRNTQRALLLLSWGGFPDQNRLQKKTGTLILSSLLEGSINCFAVGLLSYCPQRKGGTASRRKSDRPLLVWDHLRAQPCLYHT